MNRDIINLIYFLLSNIDRLFDEKLKNKYVSDNAGFLGSKVNIRFWTEKLPYSQICVIHMGMSHKKRRQCHLNLALVTASRHPVVCKKHFFAFQTMGTLHATGKNSTFDLWPKIEFWARITNDGFFSTAFDQQSKISSKFFLVHWPKFWWTKHFSPWTKCSVRNKQKSELWWKIEILLKHMNCGQKMKIFSMIKNLAKNPDFDKHLFKKHPSSDLPYFL